MRSFQNATVTIALLFSERLPYGTDAYGVMVRAALGQDCPNGDPPEILVVDDRGPTAPADFVPAELIAPGRVRHLPGTYETRAAMFNAAIHATQSDYLLLINNTAAEVVLRRSAARTMLMAATRRGPVGFVYADYERVDASGARRDVHLLDWHPGRLRDAWDFGPVILCPIISLREAGMANERYKAADWYDLRLRMSEHGPLVHVANRYAGALYSVKARATEHNVFDYLLADKYVQLEMEEAVTEHLKRTGTYLAPGEHARPVEYDPEEEERFAECIASVVIPVNNRPEFIGWAIESVQAQTISQVEAIVVVNGGPEDPTIDAVRRYQEGGDRYDPSAPPVRLIVVDVNNLGLCLNTGIAAAAGKYYVQLDSDDRLKPDAVAKLLEVFASDRSIGMVVGSYEVSTLLDGTGEVVRNEAIPVVTHDEWTANNGRNNLLRINGAGAPRSAHIKAIADVGWFGVNDDPSCRNYGEDYDLVLRMSERYTIGRVWDPIYQVVRHSGGTDHSIDQATIDRNDNAKDHMRRAALLRRMALNARGGCCHG